MTKSNEPPNSPRHKRRTKPYTKAPYTPTGKQVLIGAMALAGKNKTEIAKMVNVDRETVSRVITRIMSQSEMAHALQSYRTAVIGMVPTALEGLESLLKQKDRTAILETLYGTQVLIQKQQHEVELPQPERDYAFPRMAFFHKHGRWPTLEEAKAYDKTIEVQPLIKDSATSDEG